MNHDCHGDFFQVTAGGQLYYRCLRDGSVHRLPSDTSVNVIDCPGCGRRVVGVLHGVVPLRAVAVVSVGGRLLDIPITL